ncbi:hypothetical protein RRG08_057345 [Elysia crispata]|uniref:Uncharacterized protein n=1 Tax=Elysia crispata TaxID=231223 RepID=A0AAE0YJ41_9GAST|nr:hypothetical protein RRG08_057345 [Elysia crispata]
MLHRGMLCPKGKASSEEGDFRRGSIEGAQLRASFKQSPRREAGGLPRRATFAKPPPISTLPKGNLVVKGRHCEGPPVGGVKAGRDRGNRGMPRANLQSTPTCKKWRFAPPLKGLPCVPPPLFGGEKVGMACEFQGIRELRRRIPPAKTPPKPSLREGNHNTPSLRSEVFCEANTRRMFHGQGLTIPFQKGGGLKAGGCQGSLATDLWHLEGVQTIFEGVRRTVSTSEEFQGGAYLDAPSSLG